MTTTEATSWPLIDLLRVTEELRRNGSNAGVTRACVPPAVFDAWANTIERSADALASRELHQVIDADIFITLVCDGDGDGYTCPAIFESDATTITAARAAAAMRDEWTTVWRSADGIQLPRLVDVCAVCAGGAPF